MAPLSICKLCDILLLVGTFLRHLATSGHQSASVCVQALARCWNVLVVTAADLNTLEIPSHDKRYLQRTIHVTTHTQLGTSKAL